MNFKKMFPEDGPTKISETAFAAYQNLNGEPDEQTMLEHWLRDGDGDELRILYLRDLLRSIAALDGTEAEAHAYYKAKIYVEAITRNSDFRSAIRCSSKMRREFYDELLYNLKMNFYGKDKNDVDELIWFMIPHLSEEEGRELWKYHWLANLKRGQVRYALQLISRNGCKPAWLNVEIERLIMAAVTEEIHHFRSALEKCSKLYPQCINGMYAVTWVQAFIDDERIHDRGNYGAAVRMMKFLCTALPENVKFIDYNSLFGALRLLASDPKLVLRVARRHLLDVTLDALQRYTCDLDWEINMCWLIILRNVYEPDDAKFGWQLQTLLGDMSKRREGWVTED